MSIKQNGGVFGRNPTFNDVTIEGDLIINGEVFTGLDFQGSWNASTNSPTLASSVGTNGEFYIVSIAGTTDLNGITNWGIGDWAIFNGTVWQRVEGGADGNFNDLTANSLNVNGTATMDGLTVSNGTNTTAIPVTSDRVSFTAGNSFIQGTGALFVQPAGDLVLNGTGAEIMRLKSGKVGIGTSSPSEKLTVAGNIQIEDNDGYLQFKDTNGATNNKVRRIYNSAQALYISRRNDDESLEANDLVIDSSGNVLVGATSTTPWANAAGSTADNGIVLREDGIFGVSAYKAYAGGGNVAYFNRTSTDGDILAFNKNGTAVGSVSVTSSATAYNTSSDYRLKEDEVPMTGATERVKALRPINFAWKVDGSRVDGFFAHETQEVVPEAVHGTKDAMRDEEYEVTPAVYEDVTTPAVEAVDAVVDEDGLVITEAVEAQEATVESVLVSEAVMGTRSVPDYQGIDQSKLVPLLTAALQEAITKIEALTTRIETLEGQ